MQKRVAKKQEKKEQKADREILERIFKQYASAWRKLARL